MPKRKREVEVIEELTPQKIEAHYEEVITKRSLKFIPEESLKNEFKKTVIRQKMIDRLCSLKKQGPNGNLSKDNLTEIGGLIRGINEELKKLKQVNLSKPQEFYKKMLTEQKSVLEGLQGTKTPDNVNSNRKRAASFMSSSDEPSPKKTKHNDDVPMDLG